MKTKLTVAVRLKAGVLDPQGNAIKQALTGMNAGAALYKGELVEVRQGKIFDIEIDCLNPYVAEQAARAMAEKLLANTVVEDFEILNQKAPKQSAAQAAAPETEFDAINDAFGRLAAKIEPWLATDAELIRNSILPAAEKITKLQLKPKRRTHAKPSQLPQGRRPRLQNGRHRHRPAPGLGARSRGRQPQARL